MSPAYMKVRRLRRRKQNKRIENSFKRRGFIEYANNAKVRIYCKRFYNKNFNHI